MPNEIIAPKPDLTEADVLAKLNELDNEEKPKVEDDLDIPDIKEEKKEKTKDKEKIKDKDEEVEEKEVKEDDEEEEEIDEEKLTLEDDEEDELKVLIPARRKDILKEFPTLFKKFPAVERAMYREQAYTEVYPTIKEAKESVEKLNTYKELETAVLDGNIESLLKNVKESDPEALNRIADNYLSALYKVDQKTYDHVLNNIYRYTIKALVQTGRAKGDDNLVAAAEILHKHLYDTNEFKEPTKLAKEKDDKVNEVDKAREEFLRERFEDARDELGTRIDNKLKSVISDAIDPKDEMSDYVKSKAIEDCVNELHKQIGSDTRTQKIMKNLWEQARVSKFDKTSVSKIGSAYLSVAKSLLLPIIRENRTRALSGAKRLVKNNDTKEKFKGSNDEKGERTSSKKMKPGESVEDFMMRD